MADVTRLLALIQDGDRAATNDLLPLVYDELRCLAAQKLSGEKPGQTLQATALVHEAYVRLVGTREQIGWDSRGHFFAAAAEAMRRILIERARQKLGPRRGGGRRRLSLSEFEPAAPDRSAELLALNDALEKFEQREPRKAALVKLRFFAGLTAKQAARALGISLSTADNDWAYARCWLRLEMSEDALS